MKLVCPCCGYAADADGFIAEIESGRAVALALKVPSPLAGPLMSYLRLFRPAQRHLTGRKVEKLLAELLPMIAAGRIERHGRQWVAPVDAWAAAMEELASRRDKLTLPLHGHGYLLEMLSGNANGQEAARESKTEDARRVGAHRGSTDGGPRSYAPVVKQQSAPPPITQAIPPHIREHFVNSGLLKTTDQSATGDTDE